MIRNNLAARFTSLLHEGPSSGHKPGIGVEAASPAGAGEHRWTGLCTAYAHIIPSTHLHTHGQPASLVHVHTHALTKTQPHGQPVFLLEYTYTRVCTNLNFPPRVHTAPFIPHVCTSAGAQSSPLSAMCAHNTCAPKFCSLLPLCTHLATSFLCVHMYLYTQFPFPCAYTPAHTHSRPPTHLCAHSHRCTHEAPLLRVHNPLTRLTCAYNCTHTLQPLSPVCAHVHIAPAFLPRARTSAHWRQSLLAAHADAHTHSPSPSESSAGRPGGRRRWRREPKARKRAQARCGSRDAPPRHRAAHVTPPDARSAG